MISYAHENLFKTDSVPRDYLITDGNVAVNGTRYSVTNDTVTITNSLLDSESVSIRQILCSESQLRYGSCNASSLTFTMHENIPTLKGKVLKTYMYLNNDASTMLLLGKFKVEEDKLSSDRTVRNITAYDAMYNILNTDVASWYTGLAFPMSLLAFRTSFLNHFGIVAETATLANDTMTITKTIEPEQLTGADVIKAICEINGCFGMITNEGKFRYLVLEQDIDSGLFPSDTLYPANNLYPEDPNPHISQIGEHYYTSVEFEDYMSSGITKLTIRGDKADVGATVGTDGNHYIITGNFLAYGKNASTLTGIANNILPKIANRYYIPCTVNCIGNPCHEVGDPIRIRTKYRGIVTYILERDLKGVQALKDTYRAQGDLQYTEELNSLVSQFKQLEGRTASLTVDVDGITGRVESIEDGTASVITQLDNSINLKVSKASIVDELDRHMSGINIEPDKIEITSDGTFTVSSTNFNLDTNSNITLNTDENLTKGIFTQTSYDEKMITTIKAASISCGFRTSKNSPLIGEVGFSLGNSCSVFFGVDHSKNYINSFQGYINGSRIITQKLLDDNDYITELNAAAHGIITTASIASNLPSNVLTTSSSISTSQIDFGKTISATGGSGTVYTLTLQTITVGSNQYVMYAYKKPTT